VQLTKRMLHPVMVLVLLGLCSCASEGPTTHLAPARVYSIAPKDMVILVKHAIAAEPLQLGVAQDEGSVLTTTWREYRGNFHILRYWQERTQFRINIIPDWQNPQTECRIEIAESTQERSNRRGDWRPNADTFRPERCEEVLTQIDKEIPPGTKVSAAAAPAPTVAPVASNTAASPATPVAPAVPAVAATPAVSAGWRHGAGSFTTTFSVADAGRQIETVIKTMQLEIKQSKLTAIDGVLVAQGATGPEVSITIQAETSGATRVTVSQLGDQSVVSANPQLVFARLQQELTK
jgi:hypothetical protein